MLVATASVTFRGPGKAKVKITLTGEDRRPLKTSKHIKLTESGSLTLAVGHTTTETKRITLKR